jgi:hypothetical protein
MTLPEEGPIDPNTDWPTLAYIDSHLPIVLAGSYLQFLEPGVRYDPELIATDMLAILGTFVDDEYIPRAVALEFAEVAEGLDHFSDSNVVLVADERIGNEGLRQITDDMAPDVDVLLLEQLAIEEIGKILNDRLTTGQGTRRSVACRGIEVRASDFVDLAQPSDRKGEAVDAIYVDDIEAGFTFEVRSQDPLHCSLSVTVLRGIYGVEGMSGSRRLQANVSSILETMPNYEVRRAFEPLPPDHWSLLRYN